jgi:DNA mismatch repair protein MutL
MKIQVLDDRTINKIAAGEVVERPAAIVREVLENAIDAGADDIRIDLEGGGTRLIRIRDNGCGMSPEDAKLCLQRHATSKIKSEKDLFSVTTLGFRGEAIPSIASVTQFEIITRTKDSTTGSKVVVDGGNFVSFDEVGGPVGTALTARNLFYNVPARKKFLRTEATELSHCLEAVIREVLIRPQLDIEVRHNRSILIRAPKTDSLVHRAIALLGNSCASLLEVSFTFNDVEVKGLVSPVGIHRSSSQNSSYLYVNNRYVKDTAVRRAIREAYAGLVPKGRFPTVILNLNVNPSKVDVNVHPAKTEVRFHQIRELSQGLTIGLRNALQMHGIKRESKIRKEKVHVKLGSTMQALPFSSNKTNPRTVLTPYVNERTGNFISSNVQKVEPERGSIDTENKVDEREFPPNITCNTVDRIISEEVHLMSFPNPSVMDPLSINWPSFVAEDDIEYNAVELLPVQKYSEMRVIGQLGLTYILCEANGELVIIDQHAAHERITLFSLQRNREYNLGGSQYLLTPLVIDLTAARLHAIEPYFDILMTYGLDVESFGGNSIVIRKVPHILQNSNWQRLIDDIADDVSTGGNANPIHERIEHILATRACHNSIRAGDELSVVQMQEILSQLDQVDFGVCAHGRPVAIRVTPAELEKRFHRN